jgi:hypothetical protein
LDDFPLEPADPRFAWLPAVLPASARSLEPPDFELGAPRELSGEAEVAAVPFLAPTPEEHPVRLVRGLQRVLRSASIQWRVAAAGMRLEQLGYPSVEILTWNLEGELGAGALPLGAVAVGRKGPSNTVLQSLVGSALTRPPLLREGAVVALTDTNVYRVSIGPSRPVDGQVRALRSLRAAGFDSPLVPWPLEDGKLGLGHWSREPLLRGTPPERLDGAHLDECVEFLAELFEAPAELEHRRSYPPELASLGERVSGLRPLGFAHGDFHTGNLLTSGGRLTGVIDWDAAGPRLPLHDYLHLIATDDYLRHRRNLGPTIVQFLLPWARSGGDERARGLLSRIGVEATPDLLENLVTAYWLDFVGRDLVKSSDRAHRRRWHEENIDLVAKALA